MTTNIQETSQWEDSIPMIETGEPVLAGTTGNITKQVQKLANRTSYLKSQLENVTGSDIRYQDAVVHGVVGVIEPGQPWYPPRDAKIVGAALYQATPPTTVATKVDVLKVSNAIRESLFGDDKLVLPLNQRRIDPVDLDVNLAADEYLLLKVIEGSGDTLTVRIYYQFV